MTFFCNISHPISLLHSGTDLTFNVSSSPSHSLFFFSLCRLLHTYILAKRRTCFKRYFLFTCHIILPLDLHILQKERDDDGRIDTLCSIFKSILKALEMEDGNKCAFSFSSSFISFVFFSLVLFRSLFRTRNR